MLGDDEQAAPQKALKWINLRGVHWALYEARDVPAACVAALTGVAAHAKEDGSNAYPSVPTLALLTRKSARQVARDIETLLTLRLIRMPYDQSAARHLPADRRPTVYDLAYAPMRPFVDPKELDPNAKGRRRRPAAPPTDLSSVTGRDLSPVSGRTSTDLTPTSGRDLSPMTERPDVGVQTDLSSTSGKEAFEKPLNNPSLNAAQVEKIVRVVDATDEEAREIVALIEKEREPSSLGAYMTTLTKPEKRPDLLEWLERVRAAGRRSETRAWATTLDGMPECPHGVRGGRLAHPESGKPVCPLCRSATRQPSRPPHH